MHTLADLLGQVRNSTDPAQPAAASLLRPNTQILLPGQKAWKLPAAADDASPVDAPVSVEVLPDLDLNDRARARTFLLNEPTLRAELTGPDPARVAAITVGMTARAHHRFRRFLFAVAVDTPAGRRYGRAVVTAVDGEPRPGRSTILAWDERWTDDLEGIVDDLASHLIELPTHTAIKPEPGAGWLDALALLGDDSNPDRDGPPDWERRMSITAALYAVRLDIRPDPDSAIKKVLGELTSSPPAALLVWEGRVRNPDVYLGVMASIRPDAYAARLGTAGTVSPFDDDLAEFRMHLDQVSPVFADPKPDGEVDWSTAATRIRALVGNHFALSARADKSLDTCAYPDPARMLAHVEALERLAKTYAERGGVLGGDIGRIAHDQFGIEVALTDRSLPADRVIDGQRYDTRPHVKVDDYKSPDQCGRIYFAIVTGEGFFVDHIGLHDYG